MPDLDIDTAALRQACAQLRAVREDLIPGSPTGAASSGHAGLDAAGAEFSAGSDAELMVLAELVDGLAAAGSAAATAFDALEDGLVH